jgi:glycosyltransferase involved in cell wall biosynthesis
VAGVEKFKVRIIQPVIPAYRLALFQRLAVDGRFELSIAASDYHPGEALRSVDVSLEAFQVSFFKCSQLFGHDLFWQHGISELSDLGRGDVLVLGGNPRFLNIQSMLVKARLRGIGVLWWGHGWTAGAWRSSAWVRRQIMKLADCVLLYHDDEVFEYQRLGFRADRLFSTNNAMNQAPVRLAREQWTSSAIESFQRANGIDPDRLLLFCSRLSRKNRVDLAIRALQLLVRRDPGYRLAIIGDGQDQELAGQLANRLGVSEQVRWLGALDLEEKMAPWFLSARCLVHPRALGLTVLHAFGYGLPVVTTDNRREQMPEARFVLDHVNGLLFHDHDFEALARKAAVLCEEQSLRAKLSSAADAVARRWDLDAMTGRFVQAILRTRKLTAPGNLVEDRK